MGKVDKHSQSTTGKDDSASKKFMTSLCGLIENLEYVPIVSSAVYYERLFNREKLVEFIAQRQPTEATGQYPDNGRTKTQFNGDGTFQRKGSSQRGRFADPLGCSIEDILSEAWATEIGFPLPEKHMLPRVALFDRFKHSLLVGDSNRHYLHWLRNIFLDYAEFDLARSKMDEQLRNKRAASIPQLKQDLENGRDFTLSDIADELDYLNMSDTKNNPLAILARLGLPLYITTSPFDFLEKAIAGERPGVKTQICFRSRTPGNVLDKHKTIEDLNPEPKKPVVYHLFGLEDYPQSMVLNEDQYLEFLPEFITDKRRHMTYSPEYVTDSITRFSLLLLGYRLRDLEFRVMLKGLIGTSRRFVETLNLAIQLDPTDQCPEADAENVKAYLKDYFDVHDFAVHWDTTDIFMAKLFEEWHTWLRRKGHQVKS